MHDYLRLLLAVFTCYRLARMVAKDDGSLFIFKRLRYWAKDRAWAEADKVNAIVFAGTSEQEINDRYFGKWHNLAEGISCPYCTGVWLSLPIFLLVIKPRKWGDLFLLLMGISGMQAFLQTLDREQ